MVTSKNKPHGQGSNGVTTMQIGWRRVTKTSGQKNIWDGRLRTWRTWWWTLAHGTGYHKRDIFFWNPFINSYKPRLLRSISLTGTSIESEGEQKRNGKTYTLDLLRMYGPLTSSKWERWLLWTDSSGTVDGMEATGRRQIDHLEQRRPNGSTAETAGSQTHKLTGLESAKLTTSRQPELKPRDKFRSNWKKFNFAKGTKQLDVRYIQHALNS